MVRHQNETGHTDCESTPEGLACGEITMFVICRLPLPGHEDSKPTYRTPEGGWTIKREKAEQFESRRQAQAILDEHSWGREGHKIVEA